MRTKKNKFSSRLMITKISFYILFLILVAGLIRSVSSREFTQSLQNLFFQPVELPETLHPTSVNWCPEKLNEIEFISSSVKLSDLQHIQGLCTVQSLPYKVTDVQGLSFYDFARLQSIDSSSILQADPSGLFFKHKDLIFKSPELAEKASKYTKLQ